jgi:hypothetical protein
MKKYLSNAAEIVLNHPNKPLETQLLHPSDVKYLLGHVFADQFEAKLFDYTEYTADSVYDAIKRCTQSHKIQVIRKSSAIPKLNKSKLEQITTRCDVHDRTTLIPGGWVQYDITDPVIGEQLGVDYHSSKRIGKKLTASSIYVLNQNPTVCTGHIDADCGYLFLQSGLKLWLQVPFESNFTSSSGSWKLEELLNESKREWFLTHPGDFIIVPARTKHIVISLKPSIALGGFFNSPLGTLDSIATWIIIRAEAKIDLLNTIDDFKINSTCINAILIAFIKVIPHLPRTKLTDIKNLYLLLKTEFDNYKTHTNNEAIVDRIDEMIGLLK